MDAGKLSERLQLPCCGNQSTAAWLLQDLNDAERLSQDPTFPADRFGKDLGSRAPLSPRGLQSFETELLAEDANFAGWRATAVALIAKARRWIQGAPTVSRHGFDGDSAYGEQEQSAYNGHFESTCYHPLLLFNPGRRLSGAFRPGNVHSARLGGASAAGD